MRQPDFDIVVVGAGLVGLAFACAMKNSRYRVLVIDAGEPPNYDDQNFDIRVNSIHLASQAFLDSIGVWPMAVAKRVCPFRLIQVWNSSGGFIEFSAAEVNQAQLGHIVEQNVLTSALVERIKNISNIELKFNTALGSINEQSDQIRLQLENGQEIGCSLIVGADGGNSFVRRLSKIPITEDSYHQKAIVAQVEASEPTREIAYQKFLTSGPLAFLPLSDGSYSIVWSCTEQRASKLKALDDDVFGAELSKVFDYRLGDFSLVSRKVSFDLRKLRAHAYFKGRVVLVGDSAHVIHPLAGMGANLGLMDAAALSEILTAQNYGELCDRSLLRKYERWRKSANHPVMILMNALNSGFGSSSSALREFLGTGLTLTNQMQIAKRSLIRFACGISGDLPEIANIATTKSTSQTMR